MLQFDLLLKWNCNLKTNQQIDLVSHFGWSNHETLICDFRTLCSRLTWSRSPSLSCLIYKGHHPLVLFCLKRLTIGTLPSVFNISRVHCLTVLAPRGNRFKSRVMAPKKSSLEKWSASQTWRVSLAGTLEVVSSQENIDSFLEMTTFSSAAKYWKGKIKRQLKLPSPVNER